LSVISDPLIHLCAISYMGH